MKKIGNGQFPELKELESDSGYLKILSLSFSNARIAFGLGPKADSFADSFNGLSIFLNSDNPPIYLSTLNFIGFGKVIIFLTYKL